MPFRILASCSPGEVRVAVLESDILQDYRIWRPGSPDGVGDLYRGRIVARVPAMAGCFVALADTEGFLPDSQSLQAPQEGQLLPVRVTRSAQSGKGPRLTARLTEEQAAPAAAGPVRLVRRGPDPLTTLHGRYPEAEILVDDPAVAAGLHLPARIVAQAFDDALESRIEALASPTMDLPGGGRLHVHPTPALTAMDLDAGSATAARRSKTAAQSEFNRAALPTLAAEIRLRNLSGAILIDFAGLSPRRRSALGPDLEQALKPDPLRPRLLGFTYLGLAEILRPRVHPPLHELLSTPLAAGLAALRAAARETAANPAQSLILHAAPSIVAALQADPVALPSYARKSGRPLVLRADPTLAGWHFAPA